jgi:hypothetical protein
MRRQIVTLERCVPIGAIDREDLERLIVTRVSAVVYVENVAVPQAARGSLSRWVDRVVVMRQDESTRLNA